MSAKVAATRGAVDNVIGREDQCSDWWRERTSPQLTGVDTVGRLRLAATRARSWSFAGLFWLHTRQRCGYRRRATVAGGLAILDSASTASANLLARSTDDSSALMSFDLSCRYRKGRI